MNPTKPAKFRFPFGIVRMSNPAVSSSQLRRLFFGLSVLLLAGSWLIASASVSRPGGVRQAPAKPGPRKPAREEEEEPVKPRPKVPLRIGEDDPDPSPKQKPAAAQTIDLAGAAEEAKNPVVRKLFLDLKQPHDLAEHKGSLLRVAPIKETYVGGRPSFKGYPRLVPFDKDWKAGDAFLAEHTAVTRYEPYETLAVNRVDEFLKSGLEREPASSARYVSHVDMLRQAEKVLAAVLNWHKSARERSLRNGPGWTEVGRSLQARLLGVQVEQLSALANSGDWAGAFELAERLKDAYAHQPELQREYIKLHVQNVEAMFKGGKDSDYIAARQGLERLEKAVLDPTARDTPEVRKSIDQLRDRLRNRAEQLWRRGEALKDTDKARAITSLRTAEAIWPQLPGLQDARLKLSNAYPILYVGARHLPQQLSPASAVTDADRQALELLFESLVKPVSDPVRGQRYEAGLADGRTALVPLGRQFQLASGARWSNGEFVTAMDVSGTVGLLKQANWIGHAPEWVRLMESARVEIEDPFRIDLRMPQGYLDPLSLMTFKVLPANLLKCVDDPTFADKPVGSGPFQYAGKRQENGYDYVIFQANPNYGRRAGREQRPWIREVRFFRSRNPVIEFRNRQLDVLLDVSAEDVKQLESPEAGLSNLRIVKRPNRRVYFLAINHRRPELQNVDLRKAIAFSLDREELLVRFFRGQQKDLHRWLNGPFPRGSWAANPTLDKAEKGSPYYPYQPELARQLANKGGAKGKTLTLSYPADDKAAEAACGYMQAQIERETGLTITPRPLSPQALRTAVEGTHSYDLAYYHWDYDNECYWLWPMFDPLGIDAGGCNFLGYKDDDVLQSRFRQALSHRQFKEVQKTFRDIHEELFAKMPLVPLWQLDTRIAIQGHVQTVPAPDRLDPLRVFTDVEQWRLGK
jgi:peptide/nickel transport system substrate-binding protein